MPNYPSWFPDLSFLSRDDGESTDQLAKKVRAWIPPWSRAGVGAMEAHRALDILLARLTEAEKEIQGWRALRGDEEELHARCNAVYQSTLLRAEAAEKERDRLKADAIEVIHAIQGAKHAAQTSTAGSASEQDWDSETYYRAKAEGLQEAEKIARAVITADEEDST